MICFDVFTIIAPFSRRKTVSVDGPTQSEKWCGLDFYDVSWASSLTVKIS